MKATTKRNIFFMVISLLLIATACSNMGDSVVKVTASKCTGCGTCVSVCPHGAISLSGGKAVINSSRCVGCGRCISACPKGAISF